MFKPRQASSAVPATPPAIEVVRQRAKHRLIGASLLVLAGVVVFPVLFDTQPRPIPVDIPIEIPSRQAAKPVGKPATPVAEAVVTEKSLSQSEEVLVPSKAELSKPESKPEPKPEPKIEPKVEPKAEPKAEPNGALATKPAAAAPAPKESGRAQALLDGRDVAPAAAPAAPSGERFIVQVGAFADSALAQQVRLKLERAGLKTYTHVAETAEGKRIRVRLGPYASRSDADKAAAKAKGLGLAAAILTL